MDEKEKILKYMEKLGKAVTECLNSSDKVKVAIRLLEEAGLNLNLSFVAMVSGVKPMAFPVSWSESKQLKFEITPEDRAFLQGLGIRYDEGGAEEGGQNKTPGEEDRQ